MSGAARLLSLQAGRGIAALGVVVYHVSLIMAQPEYGGRAVLASVAQYGILGVNFFFVLSGFIILMAHYKDLGHPASIGSYGYRRAIRIYPIYWVFLILYLAASALGLGHPDFAWDPSQMLNAFILYEVFPQLSALPLKVAWTLFYEVQFYAIFVLLLINVRLGTAAIALWLVGIIVGSLMGFGSLSIVSMWNLHFLGGMAAYMLYRRMSERIYALPLLVGAIAIAWFAITQSQSTENIKDLRGVAMPIVAFGFSALLLGLTLAERAGKFRVPRIMTFLGDASYSIYLVHSAIISIAIVLLQKAKFISDGTAFIFFLVLLVVAVSGGCLAYICVERPMLEWLRALQPKSSKAAN